MGNGDSMSWRMTVKGFHYGMTVKDATQFLREIFSNDPRTNKKVIGEFDNKEKMLWEDKCPEFCNGIGGFGSDWDNGKENYILIRFIGVFTEAVAVCIDNDLYTEIGG